jgi:hypothetical protein
MRWGCFREAWCEVIAARCDVAHGLQTARSCKLSLPEMNASHDPDTEAEVAQPALSQFFGILAPQ